MAKITMYGLAKCSTVAKARAHFDDKGVEHQFVDYRDNPIEPDLLREWSEKLGGWPKVVNRASMTWRNLEPSRKDPQSDQEWLDLIAESPALIRRPVIWDGQTVTSGFRQPTIDRTWVD